MGKKTYKLLRDKSFINPYNFVRPDTVVHRGKLNESRELVTGKLHCMIYLKTPLAILDTDEENIVRDGNGHGSYKFLRTNKEGKEVPYIPGSSIRGCIRSMYETVTNSCFSTLPDNAYLTNRVATNKAYEPAILIREGERWKLYKAERLYVKITGNPFQIVYEKGKRKIRSNNIIYSFGDYVKVTQEKNNVKSLSPSVDYVLYIGEPFDGKKNESVFKKGEEIPVDETLLDMAKKRLEYSIEMYGRKTINKQLDPHKNHTGYASYSDAEKNGVIPVWYKSEKGQIMLSMAAIGRKVYKNTVNDLVGRELVACQAGKENREESLCHACQLFGIVRGSGFGSHVRFTDAIFSGTEEEKIEKVTLKELGTPRTGFLPFYSLNGMDYDCNGANINGRKFYWHNPEATDDPRIYSTCEKTERNSTVELLKEGMFEFDVYFDDISQEQLETLKWTISLGDNRKESRYCYKMGHGKPLGLGSVKICILKECFRKTDRDFNYAVQCRSDVTVPESTDILNDSARRQILIISDFELLRGMDICYPYIDTKSLPQGMKQRQNDVASHQWYSEAKGKRSGDKPIMLADINSTKDKPLHPFTILYLDDKQGVIRSKNYEINKNYEGEVYAYNDKKTVAKIRLKEGGVASLFFKDVKGAVYGAIDQVLPKGIPVIVKYDGKDGENRDKWKPQSEAIDEKGHSIEK